MYDKTTSTLNFLFRDFTAQVDEDLDQTLFNSLFVKCNINTDLKQAVTAFIYAQLEYRKPTQHYTVDLLSY